MLTCYRLKKGLATFYRPETIVASLFLLMVLSFKGIFNYTSCLFGTPFGCIYFKYFESNKVCQHRIQSSKISCKPDEGSSSDNTEKISSNILSKQLPIKSSLLTVSYTLEHYFCGVNQNTDHQRYEGTDCHDKIFIKNVCIHNISA